jgi:hypothetical protein
MQRIVDHGCSMKFVLINCGSTQRPIVDLNRDRDCRSIQGE